MPDAIFDGIMLKRDTTEPQNIGRLAQRQGVACQLTPRGYSFAKVPMVKYIAARFRSINYPFKPSLMMRACFSVTLYTLRTEVQMKLFIYRCLPN